MARLRLALLLWAFHALPSTSIRLGDDSEDHALDAELKRAIDVGLEQKVANLKARGADADAIEKIRASLHADRGKIMDGIRHVAEKQLSEPSSLVETAEQSRQTAGYGVADEGGATDDLEALTTHNKAHSEEDVNEEVDEELDEDENVDEEFRVDNELHKKTWIMTPLEAQRWRWQNRHHRMHSLVEAKAALEKRFKGHPIQTGEEALSTLQGREEKSRSKAERSFWRRHRLVLEQREEDERKKAAMLEENLTSTGQLGTYEDPHHGGDEKAGFMAKLKSLMPEAAVAGYMCVTVQVPIPHFPFIRISFGLMGTLTWLSEGGCWRWQLDIYLGVHAGISIWSGLRLGVGASLIGSWALEEVPFGSETTGLELHDYVTTNACPAKSVKALEDLAKAEKCQSGANPFRVIWAAYRRQVEKVKKTIFAGFRTVRQVFSKIVAFFRRLFGYEQDFKESYLAQQTRRSSDYDAIFDSGPRGAGHAAIRVTVERWTMKPERKNVAIPSIMPKVTTDDYILARFGIMRRIQVKRKYGWGKKTTFGAKREYITGFDFQVSHDVGAGIEMARSLIRGMAKVGKEVTIGSSAVYLADNINNLLVVEMGKNGSDLSAAGATFLDVNKLTNEPVSLAVGIGCDVASNVFDSGADRVRENFCPDDVSVTIQKVNYRGTLSVKCKEQGGSPGDSARTIRVKGPRAESCSLALLESARGVIVGDEKNFKSTTTQGYVKPGKGPTGEEPLHFWDEGRSWSFWSDDGDFPKKGANQFFLQVSTEGNFGVTRLTWADVLGEKGFNGKESVHRLHTWTRSAAFRDETFVIETLFEPHDIAAAASLQPVLTADYDFTTKADVETNAGQEISECGIQKLFTLGEWKGELFHLPCNLSDELTGSGDQKVDVSSRYFSSRKIYKSWIWKRSTKELAPKQVASLLSQEAPGEKSAPTYAAPPPPQDQQAPGAPTYAAPPPPQDQQEQSAPLRDSSGDRRLGIPPKPPGNDGRTPPAPTETKIDDIDNRAFLRATSGVYTAAGGFLSKLPKYAEQLLDRLIDDPSTDENTGDKFSQKPQDCAVIPRGAVDEDGGCELKTAKGVDAARVYRDPSEDVVYHKDADTRDSDLEDPKDDHVMNIAKALRVSDKVGEPTFWLTTTQSLGNLIVRAISDVQSIFNVYFAEDPFWEGQCSTLQIVSDLPYENGDQGEQGRRPTDQYTESKHKDNDGCGAECMAYKAGVKYAQLDEESMQLDPENKDQEKAYNPSLDGDFAYGTGYNKKDESATVNARLAFFTPDAPTRTPLGRYFFESSQDTAVFSQFWCHMAVDALKDLSSTSGLHPRVQKIAEKVPEASKGEGEDRFEMYLPEACTDSEECTERAQCEKVMVTKAFVAMFPSFIAAAKDTLKNIGEEIVKTVKAIDDMDTKGADDREQSFNNIKSSTFRALAHARSFFMALGACNGEDGPQSKAWAAVEYAGASGDLPKGALWSPQDRARLCKAVSSAGIREEAQKAPKEDKMWRNTLAKCKTFCDATTPLMKASMKNFEPYFGATCKEGVCVCPEGFSAQSEKRACIPTKEVRLLEAAAMDEVGAVAPLKPQLVADFVEAFGLKSVLPLYMQRAVVAKEQLRLYGAFFEYFKRIVPGKKQELEEDSKREDGRKERLEADLKVRIFGFVQRMRKLRALDNDEGRVELPLWQLTSSLSFTVETSMTPGLCESLSPLWVSVLARRTEKSWDRKPAETEYCVSGRVYPKWLKVQMTSCGVLKSNTAFIEKQKGPDGKGRVRFQNSLNPFSSVEAPSNKANLSWKERLSDIKNRWLGSYNDKDRDYVLEVTMTDAKTGVGGDGVEGEWTKPGSMFAGFHIGEGGIFEMVKQGGSLTSGMALTSKVATILGFGAMTSPLLWLAKEAMGDDSRQARVMPQILPASTEEDEGKNDGGVVSTIKGAYKALSDYAKKNATDPEMQVVAKTDDSFFCEDPTHLRGTVPDVPTDEDGESEGSPADHVPDDGVGRKWAPHEECNSLCGGKSFWTSEAKTEIIPFKRMKLGAAMCGACTPAEKGSVCSGQCRILEGKKHCCKAMQCTEMQWVRADGVEVCAEDAAFFKTEDMLSNKTAPPCCNTACGAPGFEAEGRQFQSFDSGAFLSDHEGTPTHCAECYWRKECPEGAGSHWMRAAKSGKLKMCCRKHQCEKLEKDEDEETVNKLPVQAPKGSVGKWRMNPKCKIFKDPYKGVGTECGAKSFMGYGFKRQKHTFLNDPDGTQHCAVCRWISKHTHSQRKISMQIGPDGREIEGVASQLRPPKSVFSSYHLLCMKFQCTPDGASLLEGDYLNETEDLDLEAYHWPNVPIHSPSATSAKDRRHELEVIWERREGGRPVAMDPPAFRALMESDVAKEAQAAQATGGQDAKGPEELFKFPSASEFFSALKLETKWNLKLALTVKKRYMESPDPDDQDQDGNQRSIMKTLKKWEVELAAESFVNLLEEGAVAPMVGLEIGIGLTEIVANVVNAGLCKKFQNRVDTCRKCVETQAYCDAKYLDIYNPKVHEECVAKTDEAEDICTKPLRLDDALTPTRPSFITSAEDCEQMQFVGVNENFWGRHGPSGRFRNHHGGPETSQAEKANVKGASSYEGTEEEPSKDSVTPSLLDDAEHVGHGYHCKPRPI
eukprot:TRINITY_DN15077_c0_g2_i4.p1 TRINITY_DN15077_c0_g2~~TRINITY_DN15077_c0_g2_i4.p1  ORF type:complete len:2630 (-),score=566.84 TRINITY_DN15077_c0_g2_i4:242-8131(-)